MHFVSTSDFMLLLTASDSDAITHAQSRLLFIYVTAGEDH